MFDVPGAKGARRVPVSGMTVLRGASLVWIPRPPSALPRREEGRERRVNLCRPLFVREVSSLGNRHRGEVLREAAPEFEHVDHLPPRTRFPTKRG
jgi:hypothetical protein